MGVTVTFWRCETCRAPLCRVKHWVLATCMSIEAGAKSCVIGILTSIIAAHDRQRS